MLVEIAEHANVSQYSPAEFAENGRKKYDINEHGPLKERTKGPLMIIVLHVSCLPGAEEVLKESEDFLTSSVANRHHHPRLARGQASHSTVARTDRERNRGAVYETEQAPLLHTLALSSV